MDDRPLPSQHVGPRSLRGLLDAVLAVGTDLDLRAMLLRVTEAATTLVDARYGALGVLDESGTGLAEFITVGVDDETRAEIGALPKGHGLLGLIIREGTSLRLADLHEHPASEGFPPNHPPMRSFLGVPIWVRGRVFGNLYLTDKISGEVFTDIDQELVEGLAAAAAVAIDNARLYQRMEKREATLSAFQTVASALLAGAGRDEILQLIARRAQQLVEADVAAVALPTSRSGELVVAIAEGAGADTILGRRFSRAESVAGEVLDTGSPAILDDASSDPRVHGPLQSLGDVGPALFVPLEAQAEAFGTLMVGRRVGTPTFGPPELDIVTSFAGQASLVVHHERQRDLVQQMALLEDQERIGRDLHDTVIQGLFATGLSLQGASRLITDPEPRRRVANAVDDLDVIVRHIRTVIFDVETDRRGDDGFRRQALGVVAEAGRSIGHEPRLTFEGAVDTIIEGDLAADLLATLRESLSNVARHAQAREVRVEIKAADTVTVTVTDDGVGPDGPTGDGPGHGLRNMARRAEARGGSFSIAPGTSGGTVVHWQVPAPE